MLGPKKIGSQKIWSQKKLDPTKLVPKIWSPKNLVPKKGRTIRSWLPPQKIWSQKKGCTSKHRVSIMKAASESDPPGAHNTPPTMPTGLWDRGGQVWILGPPSLVSPPTKKFGPKFGTKFFWVVVRGSSTWRFLVGPLVNQIFLSAENIGFLTYIRAKPNLVPKIGPAFGPAFGPSSPKIWSRHLVSRVRKFGPKKNLVPKKLVPNIWSQNNLDPTNWSQKFGPQKIWSKCWVPKKLGLNKFGPKKNWTPQNWSRKFGAQKIWSQR